MYKFIFCLKKKNGKLREKNKIKLMIHKSKLNLNEINAQNHTADDQDDEQKKIK